MGSGLPKRWLTLLCYHTAALSGCKPFSSPQKETPHPPASPPSHRAQPWLSGYCLCCGLLGTVHVNAGTQQVALCDWLPSLSSDMDRPTKHDAELASLWSQSLAQLSPWCRVAGVGDVSWVQILRPFCSFSSHFADSALGGSKALHSDEVCLLFLSSLIL